MTTNIIPEYKSMSRDLMEHLHLTDEYAGSQARTPFQVKFPTHPPILFPPPLMHYYDGNLASGEPQGAFSEPSICLYGSKPATLQDFDFAPRHVAPTFSNSD